MNVVGDATKARFIAAVIDNVMALAMMVVLVGVVPDNLAVVRVVCLFVGYLGYFVLFEGLWARTPGKYFQGLMVRKLDGSRGDWKAALIRSLLRVIEVNPALFGAIPAGLVLISTERKQRIGDILAGTVVVSDKLIWTADDASEPQP